MRSSVLACALAALLPTTASAFTLVGAGDWTWQNTPVDTPWELNVTAFPSTDGTDAQIEQAFIDSMESWNGAGSVIFAWEYDGLTTDEPVVGVLNSGLTATWEAATTGATIATASVAGTGTFIVDCDITFWGANGFQNHTYHTDVGDAPAGEQHFRYIATHELGHCLGLGHSATADAVMFASTSTGQTDADWVLDQDDIDGFQSIYGGFSTSALSIASESSTLSGNNASLEPGESISFTFSVDNASATPAMDAQIAVVSISSSDVTASVSTAFPSGDEDQAGNSSETYGTLVFDVDAACEGSQDVTVQLDVASSNEASSVTDSVTFTVDCPEPDSDDDGVPDDEDVCPGFDDTLVDGDLVPDGCDNCDLDAGSSTGNDVDGDEWCDDSFDCLDTDASVNPDGVEVTCNDQDDDCDSATLDAPDGDADEDSVCSDCDDDDPDRSTLFTEEPYDGVDNDCNTLTLDDDLDEDGQPLASDCDDDDPTRFEGATETCNGIDDDCDESVDEGISTQSWYLDEDSDGFGPDSSLVESCAAPSAGHTVNQGGDCDDSASGRSPGLLEVCDDDLDNNCNEVVDEECEVEDTGDTGLVEEEPDLATTVAAIVALVNDAHGSVLLDEGAAARRFRPSSIERKLRGAIDRAVRPSCRPSGFYEGVYGGTYTPALNGTWTSLHDATTDTATGSLTASRGFSLTSDTLTEGLVGGAFGAYNKNGRIAADRDGDGYLAGGWIRIAGSTGVFYGIYGTCEPGVDPGPEMARWFGTGLLPD